MNAVTLKDQLLLHLRHYDLSASQLARRSGVSKQVISQWLGGAAPRKLEQVKSIADALNTSVDHLCFGSGIEPEKYWPIERYQQEINCGVFEVVLRRQKP